MVDVRPSIGLCEAIDSGLLGPVRLEPRQREPCEAIDAGARLVILEWGRRSFKTGVLARVGLWHALPRPELAALAIPGEMRRILVVATSREQSQLVIAAANIAVAASPVLAGMLEGRSDNALRFRHNVEFLALPANAAGDRGRNASAVLFDESAHHHDGDPDAPKSAERLFAALVPPVSQYGALGTVVVASTPAGDSNHFAKLCDSIVEEPSETSAYFFGKTWEVNPRIREDELVEERRLLGPELFSQEYECNRLSGVGSFLAEASIEQCVSDGGDISYEAGLEFFVAIDPALVSDTFACVVLATPRDNPAAIVVARVLGWRGERSDTFEEARLREDELLQRVVGVCREYHCDRVATDVYKAREITSRLNESGIEVVEVPFSGDGRRQAFARLRLALDEGRVDMPREPQLLTELRALRVKYTAQGQAIEIPRLAGSHCDRAVALTLGIAALEDPEMYERVSAFYVPPARDSVAGEVAMERGELDAPGGGYGEYDDCPIDSWGLGGDW